jgi:NAD(P)-dependent dehydrogenase (short-subunit alcohol dehydrogenase family)
MNKIDLNNRCAVVTGGAQGFGRAITERFVASGARVAIWDHDLPLAEKTAKEIGDAVTAFKVDVSDLAAVEKTRDATLKALGKIDILVNNAGIAGVNKTVWDTDLDEWRKVLRINLDGPFICCKAIAPVMISRGYGRIVNIASIMGHISFPQRTAYSASKAGLIGFTKSLALELAQENITVVAISPGPFATEMTVPIMSDPEKNEQFMSRTPQRRWGEPQDIGKLALYLCSEDASYITGTDILIDGGWCAQ